MRQVKKIVPAAGIEKDLSPDLLTEGLYVDALNINIGYGTDGVGRVYNEKGNTQITSSNVSFVAGDRCIGSFFHKRQQVGYFFVQNADPAENKIIKYDPVEDDKLFLVAQGGDLNFFSETYVHAELVDDKYLVWVESRIMNDGSQQANPPRMIDVSRSPYHKNRSWELHVPPVTGLQEGAIYQMRAISPVDGSVTDSANVFFSTSYEGNEEVAFQDLFFAVDGFQNAVVSPLDYTVVKKDCMLEIYANDEDTIIEIEEITFGAGLLVNKDYESFSVRNIDLIKSPPNYEPTPCFVLDTSTNDNFVRGRSFQFRSRYVYRDGSKSAWSPISITPAAITATGSIIDDYNAIDVDITSSEMSTSIGRNAIRSVEVSFREGNDSVFKSIDEYRLECLGVSQQVIRFYNNRLYSVVSSDDSGSTGDTQVLKLFDSVPLYSNAVQAITDDDGNTRIALGGNTEGYGVDVDPDLSVEVIAASRVDAITIKGTVTIVKTGDQDDGTTHFRTSFGDNSSPLSGFVVYLAGTEFYGISNSFEEGSDGSFEINDVPPGKYIMRVASFRCRYNSDYGAIHNLNDENLSWQTTSSPCIDVAGSVAATGRFYERLLDIRAYPPGSIFDLDQEVGYGDIQIQDMYVAPVVGDNSVAVIEGYVRDNDSNDASNSDRLGAIGVEQQKVDFTVVWEGNDGAPFETTEDVIADCDHNGYFHSVTTVVGPNITGFARFIDFELLGQDACSIVDPTPTLSSNLYRGGVNSLRAVALNEEVANTILLSNGASCLLMNTSSLFSTNSRTTIIGNCVSSISSIPVSNAVVAVEGTGRNAVVLTDGSFSVEVYLPEGLSDSRDVSLVACNPLDIDFDYAISPVIDFLSVQFCVNNSGTTFNHGDTVFDGFTSDPVLKTKQLKSGGVYKTGIVYSDRANRQSLVVPGPEIRVPFHTEEGFYSKRDVRFSINGPAPDWASHYRIVMTRDSIYRRYLHWVADDVKYVRIDDVNSTPVDTTFVAGDATHVMVKVDNNFTPEDIGTNPVAFFFKENEFYSFTPESGDRVRLILKADGDVYGDGTELFDQLISGVYVDGSDYYVVFEDFTSFEIEDNSLVEFYTPKKVEENIYYEHGNTYAVVQSGNDYIHEGNLQNQVLDTQPAIVVSKGGDTYWRQRNFVVGAGAGFQYVVENSTPSDEFLETSSDIGRIAPSGDFGSQRYLWWNIRLSDVYIPAGNINGLSSFRALEEQSIDQDFGSIVRMVMSGNVMFVVCETKSQSVYVSKEELVDLSGSTLVGRTDRILNVANETVSDMGSKHPLSVCSIDGRVYGYDSVRGLVWQYAANGQQPINKGLINELRELSVDVEENMDLYRIVSGFNDRFKEYHISFAKKDKFGAPLANLAYTYSPLAGRFTNRKNWYPECYLSVGLNTVVFKDAVPWLCDSNETRGNFFGVDLGSYIELAVSPDGNAVARYRTIRISGDLWVSEDIKSGSNNSENDMTSRLRSGRFVKKNGQHYADFLRNSSDPNHSNPLFNGEHLRGEYIIIKLQPSNPTSQALLSAVDVEFDIAFDTNI